MAVFWVSEHPEIQTNIFFRKFDSYIRQAEKLQDWQQRGAHASVLAISSGFMTQEKKIS